MTSPAGYFIGFGAAFVATHLNIPDSMVLAFLAAIGSAIVCMYKRDTKKSDATIDSLHEMLKLSEARQIKCEIDRGNLRQEQVALAKRIIHLEAVTEVRREMEREVNNHPKSQ